MDGTKVGVLKQTNNVRLRSLLKGQQSSALESEIVLVILRNFTYQALERKLANQQLGGLLVLANFAKSHSTRAKSVRLLDTTLGRSRFTCSLGG